MMICDIDSCWRQSMSLRVATATRTRFLAMDLSRSLATGL
jgi:hypothetical protein